MEANVGLVGVNMWDQIQQRCKLKVPHLWRCESLKKSNLVVGMPANDIAKCTLHMVTLFLGGGSLGAVNSSLSDSSDQKQQFDSDKKNDVLNFGLPEITFLGPFHTHLFIRSLDATSHPGHAHLRSQRDLSSLARWRSPAGKWWSLQPTFKPHKDTLPSSEECRPTGTMAALITNLG